MGKKLLRRSVLKASVLGGIAASTFPNPAISKRRHRFKMVTCFPKKFPGLGMTAERIADDIFQLSEGRIEVKVYGAGEIVPAYEVFDAVREGVAELGYGWDGYWISKHSGAAYFGGVPGGLTPSEQVSWILYGGGSKLWDELWMPFGIKPFLAGVNQTEMFGWYKNPLNSLSDLKGLKIRMAGLPSEILNRMGATAVNIPGGEIMSSFQSGVVDAVEWGGPWMDLAFGFPKICKICYAPGIHSPDSSLALYVNKDIFDSLSEDLKKIIQVAAEKSTPHLYGEIMYYNAQSFEVITNKHKVDYKLLPKDIVRDFLKIGEDVVNENAEKDPFSKKVYLSYKSFLDQSKNITLYQEQGYLNSRGSW